MIASCRGNTGLTSIVLAANSRAFLRLRPIRTPPSAYASIAMHICTTTLSHVSSTIPSGITNISNATTTVCGVAVDVAFIFHHLTMANQREYVGDQFLLLCRSVGCGYHCGYPWLDGYTGSDGCPHHTNITWHTLHTRKLFMHKHQQLYNTQWFLHC